MSDNPYSFDPSACNPLNLVPDEPQVLNVSSGLFIILNNGLFYTKSVVIQRVSTGALLVPGIDYLFQGFDADITASTGFECAGVIKFANPSYSGAFRVTYQAVGGSEGNLTSLVNDLKAAIDGMSTRTVSWNDILNKPQTFPFTEHTHALNTDITGLNPIQAALNRIIIALSNNRVPVVSGAGLTSRIDKLSHLLATLRSDFNRFTSIVSQIQILTSDGNTITLGTLQAFISNTINTVLNNLDFMTNDQYIAESNVKNGYVNVLNYGAVLDGITDDTAAVAAAQAAGFPVFIPYTSGGIVLNNLVLNNSTIFSNGNTTIKPAAGAKFAIKMTGWNPKVIGFILNDPNGNIVSKSYIVNAITAPGATGVNVLNPDRFYVGQRVCVESSTGFWHSTYITGIDGSTLHFYSPADRYSNFNVGGRVWASFGMIYVTNTGTVKCEMPYIRDIYMSSAWAGIMFDSPDDLSEIARGEISNVTMPGSCRLFGFVEGRNAHDNDIKGLKLWGGWESLITYTADGILSTFAFTDNVFLKREASVIVNGAAMVLGTDYYWSNNDNRTITLINTPVSGTPIILSSWTYGVDGYVAEKRTTSGFPQGGNMLSNIWSLQFQRGYNMTNNYLYIAESMIADDCSEIGMLFDNCTKIGQISNIYFGWATACIVALNNSNAEKVLPSVFQLMPSGVAVLNSGSDGLQAVGGQIAVVDESSKVTPQTGLYLTGETADSILSGTVTALGNNGGVANDKWVIPITGYLIKFIVECNNAPGIGEKFIYQAMSTDGNTPYGTSPLATPWDSSTSYVIGDIISLGGVNYVYINTTPTSNNPPPGGTYWQILGQYLVITGNVNYGDEAYLFGSQVLELGAVSIQLITTAGAHAGKHRYSVCIV